MSESKGSPSKGIRRIREMLSGATVVYMTDAEASRFAENFSESNVTALIRKDGADYRFNGRTIKFSNGQRQVMDRVFVAGGEGSLSIGELSAMGRGPQPKSLGKLINGLRKKLRDGGAPKAVVEQLILSREKRLVIRDRPPHIAPD